MQITWNSPVPLSAVNIFELLICMCLCTYIVFGYEGVRGKDFRRGSNAVLGVVVWFFVSISL
jgi:hypothetical protein